jgi:hypothetical protein
MDFEMDAKAAFLCSIYYPDYDALNSTAVSRRVYSRIVCSHDHKNHCPEAEPPYSTVERTYLEQWRRDVGLQISKHIARYLEAAPRPIRVVYNPQASCGRPSSGCESQVFQITELLDHILHFADPKAQMRALQVSQVWRASSLSVIGSRRNVEVFRASQPIEYGQVIQEDEIAPARPTAEQIEEFGVHVRHVVQRSPFVDNTKRLYFPARFAQLKDLPWHTADTLNEMDYAQRHRVNWRVRTVSRDDDDDDVFWLDLSQLEMNPYLGTLFEGTHSLTQLLGRWEVNVRGAASSGSFILDTFLLSQPLLEAIGSMHITQPPCRAIGLYVYDPKNRVTAEPYQFCKRIRNPYGIQISEFLNALEECASVVLQAWEKQARLLHDKVNEAHWIDDIWKVPASPRIRIHLDNTEMSDEVVHEPEFHPSLLPSGEYSSQLPVEPAIREAVDAAMGYAAHVTRNAYLTAEPYRAKREGSWISEDLFEPMQSETGRHPINWGT